MKRFIRLTNVDGEVMWVRSDTIISIVELMDADEDGDPKSHVTFLQEEDIDVMECASDILSSMTA